MQQIETVTLFKDFMRDRMKDTGLSEDVAKAYFNNFEFSLIVEGDSLNIGDLQTMAETAACETAEAFEFSGTVEDQLSTVIEKAVTDVRLTAQFSAPQNGKVANPGQRSGVFITLPQPNGQTQIPGLDAA